MKWNQVDFAAGTLSLLTSKNGEARIVPMTGQLLEVMQEMRAYTDRVQKENGCIIPWVFHRDGEPVAGINKAWKEATRQAGCPGLLLHDLRRFGVRNLDTLRSPASRCNEDHRTQNRFRLSALQYCQCRRFETRRRRPGSPGSKNRQSNVKVERFTRRRKCLNPYKHCAGGRNRTDDTRIFSPLLYRLSYPGAKEGCILPEGDKRQKNTGGQNARTY